MVAERDKHVPTGIQRRAQRECLAGNVVPWTRALFSLPPGCPIQQDHETFTWIKRPDDGFVMGSAYPDGSRIGPNDNLTDGYGWSFVVLGEDGKATAIAYGTPPRWCRTVYGTELWGLAQVAAVSTGHLKYRQDCASVVLQGQKGPAEYLGASSTYARAWHIVHAAHDDGEPMDITWIPAHTVEADVPSLISAVDRYGNDLADHWAKVASESQRPSFAVRKQVKEHLRLVQTVARWLGHAGVLANAHGARDSTACPAEAGKRRAHNAAQPKLLRPPKPLVEDARPPALGGHSLVACDTGWKCTVCRVTSAEWNRIAPRRCNGSILAKWAARDEADEDKGMHHHASHTRWLSGDLVFCSTCGAHSEHAVKLLAGRCRGLAKGTTTVRNRLCLGKHPRTNLPLLHPPVPEHAWQTLPTVAAAAKPAEPAHAVTVPRGSAAAAKRRHAVGVVQKDERPTRLLPGAAATPLGAQPSAAVSAEARRKASDLLLAAAAADHEHESFWNTLDATTVTTQPEDDGGVEHLFEPTALAVHRRGPARSCTTRSQLGTASACLAPQRRAQSQQPAPRTASVELQPAERLPEPSFSPAQVSTPESKGQQAGNAPSPTARPPEPASRTRPTRERVSTSAPATSRQRSDFASLLASLQPSSASSSSRVCRRSEKSTDRAARRPP